MQKGWWVGRRLCRRSGESLERSAAPFSVRILDGPILGREADAPEARIGICEFEGRAKFPARGACDQLYCTFDLFARPHISHGHDLALLQRGAHFHQGAMRIHDDGVGLFTEGRFIGQCPFHDDANLEEQALAASSARTGFHYSEASRTPSVCIWRDIKSL